MSTFYSALLTFNAVEHLFLEKEESNILSRRLIQTLRSIISKLYGWPWPDLDGQLSEKSSSLSYTTTYMSFLRSQIQTVCREFATLHHINTGMCFLIDKPPQSYNTNFWICPSLLGDVFRNGPPDA